MYILTPDTYPYSPEQLRRDNPGTSFPDQMPDERLADWGVYPVAPTVPPNYDPLTQTLREDTPVQINGQWVQVWEVRAASAEEIAQRQQAIKDQITVDVQARLDAFAKTRGYDNIVSACSYATSTHPRYGAEGRYCVAVREQTWDAMFAIEADVLAGTRPIPSGYQDIEPELPTLAWPL